MGRRVAISNEIGAARDGEDVLDDIVELERSGVRVEEGREGELVSSEVCLLAPCTKLELEVVTDLAVAATAGVLEADLELEGASSLGIEHENGTGEPGEIKGTAWEGRAEASKAARPIGTDFEARRKVAAAEVDEA